ncbi:MAG: HlyD family efflux transporter periplasmic adaptor subunit [Spirochaetia bacterium]|nr:HlyD family efflux transporter periplasmic adaptor subunit [Spirochaetia bacterium]
MANLSNKEKAHDTKVLTTEERLKLNLLKRKRKLVRKRIITLVIWLIIIALVAFTVVVYQKDGRWWWKPVVTEDSAAGILKEVTVEELTITQTIDLSGIVEPNDIQRVVFRSTGAVNGVFVKEGDIVKKGDLLATIDDTSQQYEIANISNMIKSAKLEGSVSQIELYEMQLKIRQNLLDYTRVFANFDGVVATLSLDEGDYAEAGAVVMIIVDTTKLKATVEIDEIDMQSVTQGMSAELDFDAIPEEKVEAIVNYIPLLGRTTSQGIGVKDVELIIDNPPMGISPGYTFAGTLSASEEKVALVIPSIAITTNTAGVSSVRKKGTDGNPVKINVGVRYLGEGMSEVTSGGLKKGDVILLTTTTTTNSSQLGFGMPPGQRRN